MAPKSTSAGKEKLINDDEEVLQAVILADSFNKRFRPLTTHRPRCLLPICNAPLLDWTFESLALAGVQEIFVVCRSHPDQVKTAIQNSKWSRPGSGIKIVPILTAKETFSPGDAMRDIYTRGLVTSDFVLVMGDLVSNIRIDEVVRAHKERRKTNKDVIMTMVVKESGATHRTRSRGDSSVFVLDTETSECLYYEPVTGIPKTAIAHIPREILAEHPEIEIRNDLIDCSIDVCSVEVPSLFQDNFDYLDIRRDFVQGVLTSDLLMKNIHCYVAKDGYAARVKDTKSYESVSKDILSRWTFPLVPDDYHPGGHIYNHERGNKYIAKDGSVSLARTCEVGNNTLIGSSTSIDEGAKIKASVIGRNCTIGSHSELVGAYIFDGVSVGDDCVIERSIIGENVAILNGSIVPEGCIIADNVIIGPNARLRPFERLSAKQELEDEDADDEEDEEDEDVDSDVDSDVENLEAMQDSIPKDLGDESNALIWPSGPADPEDEEEVAIWKNERLMRLGDNADDLSISDEGSESSSGTSDSEESPDAGDIDPDSLSITSDSLLMPVDGAPIAEKEFQAEVKQSLDRAFAEGHSVDNAAVELKTLRMASNVSLTKVRQAVVAGIVERIPIVEEGGIPQRREIARMVDRWGELIDKIGGVDSVETITVLQEHCATSKRMPLFGQILAAFYQNDIVEEDDIRKWHRLPESSARGQEGEVGENLKKLWAIGARMIKQFDEQESDEEDEDADEESSEDEDDTPRKSVVNTAKSPESDEEDEEEESEEDDAPPPPRTREVPKSIESDSEDESEEEVPKSVQPVPTQHEMEESEDDEDEQKPRIDSQDSGDDAAIEPVGQQDIPVARKPDEPKEGSRGATPASPEENASTDGEISDEEDPLAKSTATLKAGDLNVRRKGQDSEESEEESSVPLKHTVSKEVSSAAAQTGPAPQQADSPEQITSGPPPKAVEAVRKTDTEPAISTRIAENTDEEETDEEIDDEEKRRADSTTATTSAAPGGVSTEPELVTTKAPSDREGSTDEETEGETEEETEDEEEEQKQESGIHRDRSATVTQTKPASEPVPSSTAGPSQPSVKDEDTEGETEEETDEETDAVNKASESQRGRSVTQSQGKDSEPPQGIPFPSNKSEGSSIGAPPESNEEENDHDQFFRDQFFRRQPTTNAPNTTSKPVPVTAETEGEDENFIEDDGSEEDGSDESDE